MNRLELLNDTVLLPPDWLCRPDSWAGHIPFGLWIVTQSKPRLLVELGTHSGNSYFAFCQAVQAKGLATRCYAVDTWQGDPQAGYYGEVVYQSVQEHNARHYAGFSGLLRMTFDEAVAQFADGSIDLLHIDGLHTYEAVRHDFATWLPKLSSRAVVLFHDTSVREGDFGVWKLWGELAARYPHVQFEHSNGLGVLMVGTDPPPGLLALLDAWSVPDEQMRVRRFFERLGCGYILELQNAELHRSIEGYSRVVAERDNSIADLIRQVARGREEIAGLNLQVTEQAGRIAALTSKLTNLQAEYGNLQAERDAMIASRSWRLTRPLRLCGVAARRFRGDLLQAIRTGYRLLPLSPGQRSVVKQWYYRRGLRSPGKLARSGREASVPSPAPPRIEFDHAPVRILLLERSVPRPNQDAGSVMIFNFIRIFRDLGYAVTLFPVDLVYDPDYTPALEALGVNCLHRPAVSSIEEHLAVAGSDYDLILTCRPDHTDPFLPLFKSYCPGARIIYESHDLHFVREQRQAEIENRPELLTHAAWRKAQELRIAATVDCTLVVSEEERQTLLRENSQLSIEVIPVISEIFGCTAGFADRRDLIFIGGYDHRPNVDAVLFFVSEILPLLVRVIPDIRLHVVGSHPPPEITALASANVVVHGFVPDIADLMNSVRISVNPLRFGAGVKGKLITSMCYGVPCIGTGLAVEGMGVVAGVQALVADDPAAFAEAVVRLNTDSELWARLSAEGLDFVRRRFSLEVAKEAFVSIFAKLLPPAVRETFPLERVTSGAAYRGLERTGELERRRRIEATLAAGPEPIITPGYCVVCATKVPFYTDLSYGLPRADGGIEPNWRERVVCPSCQLNNRTRAAIHLFHLLCNPAPDSRLYLTEHTTPLFAWFSDNYPRTVGSEYLGDKVPAGATDCAGLRNEDLTGLSFAEEQFDAILSFDVFELIPDYLQAFRECLRCLKPGGTLFFSVPFDLCSDRHIVRAAIDADGQLQHLLPPEYHGDPLNAGGCLCFYHFGWELLDQLRALGFRDAAAYLYWSRHYGYLGGEQLLFRAVK